MTVECLKNALALIENYFGRPLSTDERTARSQIYAAALKDIPDDVAAAALTKALTVCRYQNQLLVDWCAEIRKLQSAGQPTANDLWTQAIVAARKIERNQYYATHGGLVTATGKLTAEDFRAENRSIFGALPAAVREWAGSPAGWWMLLTAPMRISCSTSSPVSSRQWMLPRMQIGCPRHCPAGQRLRLEVEMQFRSIVSLACAVSLFTGSALASAVYARRVDELTMERDIYASREENWMNKAVERKETIEQLQTEVEQLTDTLAADQSIALTYAGEFHCTAYCSEEYPHICGEGQGITSSGAKVQPGVTVAADTSIFPYGTVILIEGVGMRVVQDTGSLIKENALDVAVGTHAEAISWSGWGSHKVWIVTGGETDAAE